MILIAGGALLLGGIATATFMGKDSSMSSLEQASTSETSKQAEELADILSITPVRDTQKRMAQVISATPITEKASTSKQEQVCEDVVITERQPERDGNVGGTVAGALIGGLVGNQVGGGNGRKAATVAGAVAGGVIGHQIDKRHVGGKVVERTERQCATRDVPVTEEKVVAWQVQWRTEDGQTGTATVNEKPASRMEVDGEGKIIGYDVAYRLHGKEGLIRMDERPTGDHLPVHNGQIAKQG